MSFADLATLAIHRRHEMEARLNEFLKKCDVAIQNVLNLQRKAQGFVQHLNCDPSDLKERFLNCMKQLDEFTYLITDFNLALGKTDETNNIEYTPVQDTKNREILLPQSAGTFNLIDALSEPVPSTSAACQNQCPSEKPVRKKVPKEDQLLIAFSSTSCSAESVHMTKSNDSDIVPVRVDGKNDENVTNDESCNLPAQNVISVDDMFSATIMHVDGASFWIITDSVDEVYKLMTDMTSYYKKNHVDLNLDQVMSMTYCACYDDESNCYYRGLFIRLTEEDMSIAEVFLVDTGEMRITPITNIQPLVPTFCDKAPYARCCHLAGVDLMSHQDKDLMQKQEEFMRQYIGEPCTVQIDDNTSESLGVYVKSSNEILNDIIVKQGLAVVVDKNQTVESARGGYCPPEIAELDIGQEEEYDDAVEAVTGYRNRDEIDICKHYKGGPEKTCFKGARCTKRHVLKHPDGWTLDRVGVVGKCRSLPLPPPGTWLNVTVAHVAHFDRFYGHIVTERKQEPVPNFGVVLPPTTLEGLVRDMNSAATRTSYKPINTIPALGELVAALYPMDGMWYRARVLSLIRADQTVEVQYIDYGNRVWVKEDEVAALCPRHAALPAQAVRCALAGVRARTASSRDWADAGHALSALLHDSTVRVHVVGREYDEIVVEVYHDGYNVAEQLVAGCDHLELSEYALVDDGATTRLVVP